MKKYVAAFASVALAASLPAAAQNETTSQPNCTPQGNGKMECCQTDDDGNKQCQTVSCPMNQEGQMMHNGQMGSGQMAQGQGQMMKHGQMGQGQMHQGQMNPQCPMNDQNGMMNQPQTDSDDE